MFVFGTEQLDGWMNQRDRFVLLVGWSTGVPTLLQEARQSLDSGGSFLPNPWGTGEEFDVKPLPVPHEPEGEKRPDCRLGETQTQDLGYTSSAPLTARAAVFPLFAATYTVTPSSTPSPSCKGILARALFLWSFFWTLREEERHLLQSRCHALSTLGPGRDMDETSHCILWICGALRTFPKIRSENKKRGQCNRGCKNFGVFQITDALSSRASKITDEFGSEKKPFKELRASGLCFMFRSIVSAFVHRSQIETHPS